MSGRYITVKRTGRFHTAPDTTVIMLELSVVAPTYDETMRYSEEKTDIFKHTLKDAGVDNLSISTANFSIGKNFETSRDSLGNYRRRRNGFFCKQELRIEFDFDIKKLSSILWAISRCGAAPEFPIVFSVKKNGAMSEEALNDAVTKARSKAELLAKACGVKLGKLIKINYDVQDAYDTASPRLVAEYVTKEAADWRVVDERSKPRDYRRSTPSRRAGPMDGIDVQDTVTFVWAIDS